MLDPRAVHIYTDGSCYKNPGGLSGCAAIVRFPEGTDEQIVDFGCGESNISRMELMACREALKWVQNNAESKDITRVLIITDSLYVKENVNRAPEWKKRGWRNLSGEPKFNENLWNDIIKLRSKVARLGVRVDFVWQKGKSTEIGKRVDKAAKSAASRGGIDVDAGYKPGSYSRSMVSGGTAQRFPAAGQVIVVRPYVKKPFRGENRISFNVFDEITQMYSGKFYAFAGPALSFELHRGNGHRVRFNNDPNYPQFLERIEGVQLPKPKSKQKGLATTEST